MDKANIFVNKFASNSNVDSVGMPPPLPADLSEPRMPPFFLSVGDVQRALALLDPRKAYGPDGVPPIVLRECSRELAPVLARLFCLILQTSIFPSLWKVAVVQPVPKKGYPADPANYRPIALTSALSKLFETLINRKLISHLEKHLLLSDHQYGFRSSRSCGDLLAYVTHVWASSLKRFGESLAVALDISKAFDRVWHAKLIAKLPSNRLCNLFSSFLTGRIISVRVDGHASNSLPINSGVPQGSVLSPTLFLLFINDLLSSTSNPVHSYADDSTLHISTSFSRPPREDALIHARQSMVESVRDDLDSILQWGAANLVNFNSSKTQCTPFSLKHSKFEPNLSFNNNLIVPKDTLSALGLNFSSDLSWKIHTTGLAKSASQKLGVLFRFRKFFTSKQLLTLYVGTIRPCMEYCGHVWGGSPGVRLLDKVQAKAIRLIDSPALTAKIPSLSLRRNVGSLCLFYRYYFGRCSAELRDCVPPPIRRPRSTRQSSDSHTYAVALDGCRIERYARTFFPSTSIMWNELPQVVFPSIYHMSNFKKNVYNHLKSR